MKREVVSLMVGIAVACFGLGYGFAQRKRMDDISRKLDKSIDELSKGDKIDISESVMDRAVDKAARREAGYAVERATATTIKEIKNDISAQVSRAVSTEYDDIASKVKDEVQRKVSKIDISALKRDVVKQAKEEAQEKLQSSMDEILEGFNTNLKNISEVYSSLSKTFSGSKDIKLSLG